MEVKLKGVGALPETTLRVDGFTVITGVNNTGKSTIMKSIYALADAAADIDHEIEREVLRSAEEIYFYATVRKEIKVPFKDFVSAIKKRESEKVRTILDEALSEKGKNDSSDGHRTSKEFANRLKYIQDFSSEKLDRSIFFERFVKDNIEAEFNNQIRNVKTNGPASIEFIEDGVSRGVVIDENEKVSLIGNNLEYNRRAIYIDTPFIFDRLNEGNPFYARKKFENHIDKLIRLMETKNDKGAIGRITIDERMKSIDSLMKKVLSGTFKQTSGGIFYVDKGIELSTKNIATGMKTFSLIKMLIEDGQIEEGSIILMDEPEAHLHPKWQLVLAEVLVLLSKEMGISIVISTHSPQMLLAIEAHSMGYGVPVNYYNTKKNNREEITLEDVSDVLEKVYGPMADAYDEADELYIKNFEIDPKRG